MHDNIKWIEENLCTFSEAFKSPPPPPNFNYDNNIDMNSPDSPNNAQISIDSIVQSYTQNILQIATESGFMTSVAPSSKQKPNTPKHNHSLHACTGLIMNVTLRKRRFVPSWCYGDNPYLITSSEMLILNLNQNGED